jgi:hypothetical protein
MDADKSIWTIYQHSDVRSWKSCWEELHEQTGRHLLLDSACITAAIRFFPAKSVLVAIASVDGKPVAAGVFVNRGLGVWSTFQPSQLPIGAWLSIIPTQVETLLRSLSIKLPGIVLKISLTQQDPALTPRPTESLHLATLDYITTAKMSLNQTFSDYWASRSKNTRQNLNKINNRMQNDNIHARFETKHLKQQLIDGVAVYANIEQNSWKSAGGTAITENDAQCKFYQDWLSTLGPDNAEVWFMQTDSGPIAADLCIKRDNILIILKTTYLEQWAKYSPAFLMHVRGIEYCIQAGIKNIEFYGPAMDWHRKLTAELRVMYHVNFYRFPILKQIKNILLRLNNKKSKN